MADLIDKNNDTGQRKRQRSHSRQEDETKEFRQITNNMMKEIASLKEMIKPISSMANDIDNIKRIMVKHGSQIQENSKKIDNINSVINSCNGGNDTDAANSARSKNQNNVDLENIVEEVKLQLQLQNKLYVTNAINEAEIRNTFN